MFQFQNRHGFDSVIFGCGLVLSIALTSSCPFVAAKQAELPSASPEAFAAEFFPATTSVYLCVGQATQLIEKIEQHPLVAAIGELPQFKKLITSPQFVMATLATALVEAQTNESILNSLKSSLALGLAIGIDPETEGLAIILRSNDEAKLKRLVGTILKVVASGAEQEGRPVPFKKGTYRELVTAEFGDTVIARYQNWFIVSNKRALAKKIGDNLIDGSKNSLATQTWFKAVVQAQSTADVWVAVDLASVREKGLAPDLFRGRTNNPGAELVLGGLLDAFKHAPWLSGQLNFDRQLDLALELPFNPQWADSARQFFYGANLQGTAPQPLLPQRLVANLVSYRDVADWWLSKEDLFEENVIAQLAQADSQLSTIFSGMDFGEDVLGALQPGIQIVVTEKAFADKYVPDIRLPAFALVGKLKESDQIRRKMKIAFQSLIGFANITLGMEGQPQLDLETENIGDAKISAAQYVYDDKTEAGLLLFNFSPTMAFQGPYMILSSDRELAIELAKLVGELRPGDVVKPTTADRPSEPAAVNTHLDFDSLVLSRILKYNRDGMVSQNMLEKGHGRKEAEAEVDLIFGIVDLIQNGQLDFQVNPTDMKLAVQLRFVNHPLKSSR